MTRPCPACAAEPTDSVLQIPEQMFGLGEVFDYLTCGSCKTVYIAEVPADLAKYYDTSAYYSFDEDPQQTMGRPGVRQAVAAISRAVMFGPGGAVAKAGVVLPQREARTLISMLEAARIGGLPRGRDTRILDVGSGAGALLYALDLAGMRQVTGIDPFADGDRKIGKRANLLKLDLSEVKGEFDLITMHHSLEHVPDPVATLEQAARVLAPGGRVAARLPTVSSEAFDTYGADWFGCDAPRHLTLLSRDGVQQLAERAGYRIVNAVDDSNEAQFWASEQYLAGISLHAPTSYYVNPKGSIFSSAQIKQWRRRARELNRQSRGDQAAWVFERVS